MSEEALKQEEVVEEVVEEGEIVELEETVEDTNELEAVEESVEDTKSKNNEEELQDYSDKVQKRINNLTRKLREAERGQDSAYSYAQSLVTENRRLKTTANSLQENTYTESASRLQSQKAQAMESLKKAHEVSDYDKVALAQDVLAKIAVQEQKVIDGKARMQQQQVALNNQTQMQNYANKQQEQQPMYNNKMQSWIDDGNDWFLNNAIMHESGTEIHEELISEGVVVESDEYFTEVNKRIRNKHPDYFSNPDVKSKPQQKVASAGRVSGQTGKKQIKLSPSEV